MKVAIAAMAALYAASVGTAALAQEARPVHPVPVKARLAAQNGSGETATVTMLDGARGLIVKVRAEGGNAEGPQPIHIHKGTCAKLDPKPAYPLKNVVKGESESTVPDVTLAMLRKGQYAINVHKSTNEVASYVACGDIPPAK